MRAPDPALFPRHLRALSEAVTAGALALPKPGDDRDGMVAAKLAVRRSARPEHDADGRSAKAVGATRASVIRRLAEHGPTPEPEPPRHGGHTERAKAREARRRAAARGRSSGRRQRIEQVCLDGSPDCSPPSWSPTSPTSLTTARDSGDAPSAWPVPASTTSNPDAVHELPARARRHVPPPSRRSPAGMTRSGPRPSPSGATSTSPAAPTQPARRRLVDELDREASTRGARPGIRATIDRPAWPSPVS